MSERTVADQTGEASVVIRTDARRVWSMVSDVTRMGEWSRRTRGRSGWTGRPARLSLVTRVTTGVKDRVADLEEGARTTLAALKRAAEGDAPAV